jgi:hypothetical protein
MVVKDGGQNSLVIVHLFSDPHFINPSGHDFHLQSNSPAIDAGIDIGLTTDFDGNPRPRGAGYDIGVYEYQEGVQPTSTPTPTPPVSLSLSSGWNEIVWPNVADYTAQSALEDINTNCGTGTSLVIARKRQDWWQEYVAGYGGRNFNLETNQNYFIKVNKDCQWNF